MRVKSIHSVFAMLWRRFCPDVIVQRRIHETLFSLSLRDHPLWVFDGAKADAERIPFPQQGHVWDLGCNIGLYAVQAARSGCQVTAFDIAKINILCLRQTALMNDLAIVAVHSPVTTMRRGWAPALTGHTEESMQPGKLDSLTFREAAARYGMPNFIKIDIQGGEADLLMGPFRDWVKEHEIAIWLETHGDCARWVWPEFQQIGPIHYWLGPNANGINSPLKTP